MAEQITEEIRDFITDSCRAELARFGFTKTVPVAVCSKCNKTPGEMDTKAPHALEEKFLAAIQRSKNPKNDPFVRKLSRLMHDTSRCCGEPFRVEKADYHLLLWQRWLDRVNMPKDLVNGQPVDGIPNMRIQYGDFERYVDDDFILMHHLIGLADNRVGELIRIFREEETRRNISYHK